jgi:choline-sulfatase
MSDQHRRNGLGCMGNPHATTPNIDRLAADGVVFENFYSNAPLCLPARMSFLTGQHPFEHRCWTNHDALPSQVSTFAHSLGIAGYETVMSGRMHIVGPDQHHGFERRPIGDFRGAWLWGGWKLKPVLGDLVDTPGMNRASMEKSGPGWTGYLEYDERIRDATIDWISERGRRNADDRPFCLVAGFLAPHCPFVCPREYFQRHYESMTLPEVPEGPLHPVHRRLRHNSRIEDLSEEEILRTRAAYYGLVEWFDALVGEVLSALQAEGMLENTMVIYTSDHGDQLGDHGLWWKSTFYESSVGVPFVISWPGHLEAGRRVHECASLMDIGATLIDVAGGPELPNGTGRSFLPLLEGSAEAWPDEVYAEMLDGHGPRRMVRRGPWKLNAYYGHEPELYNLETDPDELHNRAEDADCAEVLENLQKRVYTDWDPKWVLQEAAKSRRERELLERWVRTIEPHDPFGWPATDEERPQNYVEDLE